MFRMMRGRGVLVRSFERGVAPLQVVLNYDRSAARGMGSIKCSGNYGADLWPSAEHKA